MSATPVKREWRPADIEVGRVYVGTPCYGGVVLASFAQAMIDLAAELASRGVQMVWARTHSESLVHRARDTITATFMADADATHLIWLDADIAFRAEDVVRLMLHDVDIIGGIYPKKAYPVETVVHGLDGGAVNEVSGAVEVAVIGTGFLCTRRIVYERLREATPELAYSAAEDAEAIKPWRHHYWPCPVEDGVLWSEDYALCRRWRALGGQVWADPAIRLTHIGNHEFKADGSNGPAMPAEVSAAA